MIKCIDMTEEMKKRIGEVLIVAPCRELNISCDEIEVKWKQNTHTHT